MASVVVVVVPDSWSWIPATEQWDEEPHLVSSACDSRCVVVGCAMDLKSSMGRRLTFLLPCSLEQNGYAELGSVGLFLFFLLLQT